MPSMETGPLDLMEISSGHNQTITSQHLQEMMGGYPMDQQKHQQQDQEQERKMKPPQSEQPLHCPRCDSTNTKFCYYNNYSLTQPRYFCKGCRRYWTQGGTLRNVPVGGGCRKNKRSPSSSSKIKGASSPTDQPLTTTSSNPLYLTHPPPLSYDPSDLTLSFTGLQSHDHFLLTNPNPNTSHAPAPTYLSSGTGLLDILRNGFIDSTTTTTTAPSQFQNYYYGYGPYGGSTGECVIGEEIVMPFDGSSAASQVGSSCKGVDGGENKPLMGLPWQLGSGDGEYWNGVGSANWHGLINSSLM